jgi:hypothetical protein
MGVQTIRHKGAAIAALAGLGALLAACGSQESGFARVDAANAAVAAQPVAVSCEPNQRAVVRQVAANGVLQAQVQCESVGAAVTAYAATTGIAGAPVATPVGYQTFQPAPYPAAPAGYGTAAPVENTRVVPASYPAAQPAVITRSASPVTYQRAPERIARPKRSVAKSAVIIGSSAGIGAGVGAAVGGKKGAGIGALIGGGGAALWDQITRRKQ